MSTKVFIRHARKEYRNGKSPTGTRQHDPSIVLGQEETIFELTDKLVKDHGLPEVVFVSPFLRTQETSFHIFKHLDKKFNHTPQVYTDRRVEEFLGFQGPKGKKADVSTFTAFHSVPLLGIEKVDDLERRAYDFADFIKSYDCVVWVITHGFFIDMVHKKYNGCFSVVKNLGGIVIKREKCSLF